MPCPLSRLATSMRIPISRYIRDQARPCWLFSGSSVESGGGFPAWFRDVRWQPWSRVQERKYPGIRLFVPTKKNTSRPVYRWMHWRSTMKKMTEEANGWWSTYSWNFFIQSLVFVKDCSECGPMGGARSSYCLCDNILDHGDLQVHLWLVQLLLEHHYI